MNEKSPCMGISQWCYRKEKNKTLIFYNKQDTDLQSSEALCDSLPLVFKKVRIRKE